VLDMEEVTTHEIIGIGSKCFMCNGSRILLWKSSSLQTPALFSFAEDFYEEDVPCVVQGVGVVETERIIRDTQFLVHPFDILSNIRDRSEYGG